MELLKAHYRIAHLVDSMRQSDDHLAAALFGSEADRIRLREQLSHLQQPSTPSGSPRRGPGSPQRR